MDKDPLKTLPDWQRLGWFRARNYTRALRRQMSDTHLLHGKVQQAIACNRASDDVLFSLKGGGFAVVHLTWRAETSSKWPTAQILTSLEELADPQRPVVDQLCPTCGANWTAGDWGEGCDTCGGFAMSRPCPMCKGACGAVWHRAVLDSQDQRQPIMIGSCHRP